ncbi:unnamed protein product, partial [Effrenium voratum]
QGAEILEALQSAFQEIPGARCEDPVVALRMTKGPSKGCINFHVDGDYATGTVQIALSEPSEYQGGELMFFVNDHLHVLDRPAGSICQHPPCVLHAVAALHAGTRKSLFVVDRSNGLGENGVIHVTEVGVHNFLEHQSREAPQVQRCALCMILPSDHVLLPCGHLCMCRVCVATTDVPTCPLCRQEVLQKTRVYL